MDMDIVPFESLDEGFRKAVGFKVSYCERNS